MTQLLVAFDRPVTLDEDAFELSSDPDDVDDIGYDPVDATVAVTAVPVLASGAGGGFMQYVLTFDAGSGANSWNNSSSPWVGNQFTTLKDGLWKLHTDGTKIHDAADSGNTAANRDDAFWVLFGSAHESNQSDDGTTTTRRSSTSTTTPVTATWPVRNSSTRRGSHFSFNFFPAPLHR